MIRYISFLLLIIIAPYLGAAKEEKIAINFRNTNINAVIESVSKITGKNFLVDPKVRGDVTLISNSKISKNQLYNIFLSVLSMYNYTTITSRGLVKILPIEKALKDKDEKSLNNRYKQIVQVFKLNHIESSKIVGALRPMLSTYAKISSIHGKKIIIIRDTAYSLKTATRIIAQLDNLKINDLVVIPLKYADAKNIANNIKRIYAKFKSGLIAESNPRTNSVVIAAPQQIVAQIKQLVEKLDVSLTTEGNTEVVYLKYAKAKDLAPLIKQILSSPHFKRLNQGKFIPNNKNRNNKKLVQHYETINALIISAPSASLAAIKKILRKLDIPRMQVLIEAIIAEIIVSDDMQVGTDIAAVTSAGAVVQNLHGGLTSLAPYFSSSSSATLPQLSNGISLGIGDIKQGWGTLFKMLRSTGNTNILSTPSITTLDNEKATIVVGQQVPFNTGSYSPTTGSGVVNTIERKDVGIKLTVTPQINDGDTVTLIIKQEVSNVEASAKSAFGAADVVTSTRSIETSVLAQDNQIIALGGLIDKQQIDTVSKVPLLGDIPILGWLFKYTSSRIVKRNLVLFLRPRIIANESISSSIGYGKYNNLRTEQLQLSDESVFFKDKTPLLNDLGLSDDDLAKSIQKSVTKNNASNKKNINNEQPQVIPSNTTNHD